MGQPRSEKGPSNCEVPHGAIWDVNVKGCPCGQPSKPPLVDDYMKLYDPNQSNVLGIITIHYGYSGKSFF